MKYILFVLLTVALFSTSCKKDEEDIPEPVYPLFLVIVDPTLYTGISGSLNTYVTETARGDSSAKVIEWSGTSAVQLRDTLESYYSRYNILGALLIGNLPVVHYEMYNWDKHEEFPCDLFYASPSTNWFDDDSDGIYDRTSGITIRYFVSRIQGSVSEINSYFSKASSYRSGNTSSIPKKALLFIDNDWSDFYASEKFNLNTIYSVVDVVKDTTITTRQKYIDCLSSGGGAEYVMQLIHASYEKLYIQHLGSYQYITQSDLVSLNPKARFYNLFNCSACNFDNENLGMYYVMKTSYGLAVMGTTKTGGNYYPQSFNNALSQGKTWGEAWVKWWSTGASSLESQWTMGLVLFGDPMLKVNRTATKSDVIDEGAVMAAPDRMMYGNQNRK